MERYLQSCLPEVIYDFLGLTPDQRLIVLNGSSC
jgi:hypothetical protein